MINIVSFLKIKTPDNERKKLFVESIINSSSPNFDFYAMVSLAAIITSMGLIVDNIALVMAGMIVAPLLSPLLAIALGFSIFSPQMIYRSIKILLFATVLSMFFSMLTGMIFKADVENILLLKKMDISWINFSIAIVAGGNSQLLLDKAKCRGLFVGRGYCSNYYPATCHYGIVNC